MILADAINLPLVAGLGLVTVGPLTLLVTAMESLVFKFHLKTGFRPVFKRVLVANIISTLAGGLLLMFQDVIIYVTGIRESIPAFVRGYQWVGPVLVAGYFFKSVLVEGFWLTRRRFLERIERPMSGALRTVLLANVFSYLIVGPLFYITTRPHFAGLDTTFDTGWTANPNLVVYYIDQNDAFVKRMRLGTAEVETLIPHPAWAFLISDDESTFAYVGTDGSLYAYQVGGGKPVLVRDTRRGCFLTTVSIAPNNQRIAYIEPPAGVDWPYDQGTEESLKVMELGSHEVVEVGKLRAEDWGPPIAWSANGSEIYALRVDRRYDVDRGRVESETRTVYVFSSEPPYGLREKRTDPPTQSEIVVNYGRLGGNTAYVGGRPMMLPKRRFRAAGYDIEVWPYLGSGVRVEREGKVALQLQNEYGLLNLSLPPIQGAASLPNGDELLLEWWGQTYLLSLPKRRLGLAARGDQFALRAPEYRVSFESEEQ